MKEHIRNEFEKLKSMTFKKKVEYIWEYYKWGILAAVFIIFIAVSIITAMTRNNPNAVTIMACDFLPPMVSSEDEELAEEKLNDSFVSYTGMDKPSKPLINVDASVSLATGDDYMATMMRQKLIATLGAGAVDIMIGKEADMEEYASLNTFDDIRNYLSEDTVSMLEEKNLICKATVTPDETDDTDTAPYEVYYGIKIDNSSVLKDAGYETAGSVVALIPHSDKYDISVQIVQMIIANL